MKSRYVDSRGELTERIAGNRRISRWIVRGKDERVNFAVRFRRPGWTTEEGRMGRSRKERRSRGGRELSNFAFGEGSDVLAGGRRERRTWSGYSKPNRRAINS